MTDSQAAEWASGPGNRCQLSSYVSIILYTLCRRRALTDSQICARGIRQRKVAERLGYEAIAAVEHFCCNIVSAGLAIRRVDTALVTYSFQSRGTNLPLNDI